MFIQITASRNRLTTNMAKQTGPSVKAMLTERNAIEVEVRRVVERSSAVLQCVLIGDLQAKAI